MMQIFTVSFFGYRQIKRAAEIEARLHQLLYNLISQKEYVEFLIGRDGDFDLLASSAIRRAIRSFGCGNTHFTLVLPYLRAEYRDNAKQYLQYYDEVEICAASAAAHPKSEILLRNREMIDRSDLVICCIPHQTGGAYHSVQYARKQGKCVVNLAELAEK